jgi:hypothetical protein
VYSGDKRVEHPAWGGFRFSKSDARSLVAFFYATKQHKKYPTHSADAPTNRRIKKSKEIA